MALAKAVDAVNNAQPGRLATQMTEALGDLKGLRVGLLGLAFKADTDDIRDSPALALARELRDRGAGVVGCDPQAAGRVAETEPWLEIAASPLEAAQDADAIVLTTDWPAYVTADFAPLAAVMRRPFMFDARNALDPARALAAGGATLRRGCPAATGQHRNRRRQNPIAPPQRHLSDGHTLPLRRSRPG
jgi:UDPglucose 6-dehydrogenase